MVNRNSDKTPLKSMEKSHAECVALATWQPLALFSHSLTYAQPISCQCTLRAILLGEVSDTEIGGPILTLLNGA